MRHLNNGGVMRVVAITTPTIAENEAVVKVPLEMPKLAI